MSFDDDDIFSGNDDDVFTSPSKDTNTNYTNSVPGYLRSALERYIKENPKAQESFTRFNSTSSLIKFIKTFELFQDMLVKFNSYPSTGPLLRSVVSVLDKNNDGLIQRHFNALRHEPTLLNLHLNLSLVSSTHQAILDKLSLDGKENVDSLVFLIMEHLADLADIYSCCIREISQIYIESCELAGIEPDTKIIEFGLRSEGDMAFVTSLRTTQILSHYEYGDVSAYTSLYEESTRKNFVKYFIPLLFFDESQAAETLTHHIVL